MDTIILSDGSKRHTLDGWVGIQPPHTTIVKTKWRRTDFEYYTINGYSVVKDNVGRVTCNCKGYHFRKNCRHIKEVREGASSRDVNSLFTEGELQEHQDYINQL